MPSLTSKATRALVLSAGAVGILAAAVPTVSAQQAGSPQMPKGWFKVCGKEQDFDICNVQNQVIAQTGQMLVGDVIFRMHADIDEIARERDVVRLVTDDIVDDRRQHAHVMNGKAMPLPVPVSGQALAQELAEARLHQRADVGI